MDMRLNVMKAGRLCVSEFKVRRKSQQAEICSKIHRSPTTFEATSLSIKQSGLYLKARGSRQWF